MNKFQQTLSDMVKEALFNWEFDNESLDDNVDGAETKANLEIILGNIEDYDEHLIGGVVNNRDFDKLEDYVLAYK